MGWKENAGCEHFRSGSASSEWSTQRHPRDSKAPAYEMQAMLLFWSLFILQGSPFQASKTFWDLLNRGHRKAGYRGARLKVQESKVLAALPEDPGLSFSTHRVAHDRM